MTPARGTPLTSVLRVRKAEPVGAKIVPDLHILVQGALERPLTLEELKEQFQSQAKEIALALRTHLPGGTLDQLIIELLQMKASYFVVPYGG
jgi:hypothetical protein